MLYFILIQLKIFKFFLITSLTSGCLEISFLFQTFGNFADSSPLLICDSIPLWSEKIVCMISFVSNILRVYLRLRIQSILVRILCTFQESPSFALAGSHPGRVLLDLLRSRLCCLQNFLGRSPWMCHGSSLGVSSAVCPTCQLNAIEARKEKKKKRKAQGNYKRRSFLPCCVPHDAIQMAGKRNDFKIQLHKPYSQEWNGFGTERQ